ncbi:MAG: glycoside hydrolase family 3 protein [Bacteroidales bacterium]|nr:glycoside hydrolase family 3 protein [Bacteroidales bacterium]
MKHTIIIFFPVVLFVLSFSSCTPKESQICSKNAYQFTATDTSWKQLSLREKIGQTMMITSDYYAHLQVGNGSLEQFFNKYPIGGMFMAQWHFMYNKPDDLLFEEFIPRIIQEYNDASKFPLFFSEDFERGTGYLYNTGTKQPVLMTLGAANDTALAYTYGQILSQESRALGINWLLHPVADLNMNPLHPLVIERAVSDKETIALPILRAQIRGMHQQGVVSTVKHFPGDGATIRDQHLITSANNLSFEQWEQTFGKVFQTLINDGCPAIMVGHLQFPAYQTQTIDGVLPPATLSKEIIQDLLKTKMGFSGVVISDAMNMGGTAGFYENPLERSIECFIAGTDMILWPDLAYMDTVEARILRGEISMERLDDAVERIWAIREHFNLLEKQSQIIQTLPENHAEFAQKTFTELAEKSVTLIKDARNDIPLSPEKTKRIFIANISHNDHRAEFQVLKNELIARGFEVRLEHDMHLHKWEWRWDTSIVNYDKYIVAFENHYFNPIGSPFLKDAEAYSLWTIKELPKEKVIGISFSNPYYNTFYLEPNPLLINAYSSDEFMQKAVVKLLMGEIKPTAVSPVELYHTNMK